jgi:hypothetical protein
MKAILSFFGLLFLVADGRSQDAAAVLREAMAKSGDWPNVKTLTYRTAGDNYNKWQNVSFRKPVPTKDEAFRSFDFGAPVYYTRTVSRYGGGYRFEFVNVGKDTTRYVYDLLQSRNGKQLQKGGRRAFEAGLLFVNETFPFYALRSVLQSADTLQRQNDSTIRRQLGDGGYEELVFNGEKRLTRISRVKKGSVTEKRFSHYTVANGLVYPKLVSQWSDGDLLRVDEVIRYVHLSHFHNDHTAGINAFLAEGATVIATPATLAAVKTIVHPELALTATYLSFSKEHLLKDGVHEVRFYEVPTGHAEGMSFVYLPKEGIIYQGDLYSLPDDRTTTPAIQATRDFYRFLQQRKLGVKQIIGHHGSSDISLDELEKAVRLTAPEQ